MPPIRKPREVFREQVRWSSTELIGILNFLDDNFELWYSNRVNASAKAIEATNNKRDARSVYNKVHVLIKNMEEYHRTGVKSNTCTIIWDNQRIYDLVENIYNKTKEKGKNDKNQGIEDCITYDDIDSDASTIRTETDDNVPQPQPKPYLTEPINKLYSEKLNQISQTRSAVVRRIEEINNKLEESKLDLVLCTKEEANDIFEKKTQEITDLRDELIKIVEEINDKYEQMRNVR